MAAWITDETNPAGCQVGVFEHVMRRTVNGETYVLTLLDHWQSGYMSVCLSTMHDESPLFEAAIAYAPDGGDRAEAVINHIVSARNPGDAVKALAAL